MNTPAPFKVFCGTKSRYMAEKVCEKLGCPLGNMNIQYFADGPLAQKVKPIFAMFTICS